MTRSMSDYSKGKIYKLYVKDIENVFYIGSTTESLSERLCHHRHQAKNANQKKTASALLFENDSIVVIELLEDYPSESKRSLEERERYWIDKYPKCINKNIPTRDWRERWYANHEHNLQKHREWLEANKEYHAEQRKQKRLANLEKQHAKDKESNARRDKEKRKAWKNAKVKCSLCNLILSRNNFPTHKKNLHQGQDCSYDLI
jgi:hypothetical protein